MGDLNKNTLQLCTHIFVLVNQSVNKYIIQCDNKFLKKVIILYNNKKTVKK